MPDGEGMRQRTDWVDAAKGLSIVLVVVLHSTLWLYQAGLVSDPGLNRFNAVFESVRMPLFFAMSGLFAAKWLRAPWSELLHSKVSVLLWAFVLWQVTVFGYRVAGGAILPEVTDGNLRSQVLFLIVSPVRPNAELWFLWALMVFFLLGRLLWRLPPALVLVTAAGASVLWSGMVQPAIGDEMRDLLGAGLFAFPQYFVFFLGAALFSAGIRRQVDRTPWPLAAAVLVVWTALFAGWRVLDPAHGIPGAVFLEQCAGVLGGVALAVLLQRVGPLAHLGRHTLEVYLSHTVFIVAVACLLHLGDVEVAGWPTSAAVAVVVPVVIALGLLVGRAAAGTWVLDAPETFRRALSGRAAD